LLSPSSARLAKPLIRKWTAQAGAWRPHGWVQVGLNHSRCLGLAAARTLVRGSLIKPFQYEIPAKELTLESGFK